MKLTGSLVFGLVCEDLLFSFVDELDCLALVSPLEGVSDFVDELGEVEAVAFCLDLVN